MTDGQSIAAARLESFIQRIERLEEEKANIAVDIKEVFQEAKSGGFDTKTMRAIIKLRKMTPEQRAEQEALLDIYKAALGMLHGTPLGEAARKRLTEPKRDEPDDDQADIEDLTRAPAPVADAEEPDATEIDGADLEKAREMGAEAARGGKAVTANPFPASDPRRAAWDESWCMAAGSDGMDLPDAWRRSKKKDDQAEKREAA